jgi:hypothetical protein
MTSLAEIEKAVAPFQIFNKYLLNIKYYDIKNINFNYEHKVCNAGKMKKASYN